MQLLLSGGVSATKMYQKQNVILLYIFINVKLNKMLCQVGLGDPNTSSEVKSGD